MKRTYQYLGRSWEVDASRIGGGLMVVIAGESHPVEVLRHSAGGFIFRAGGKIYACQIAASGNMIWVAYNGRTYTLTKASVKGRRARSESAGDDLLRSPMPGQVRELTATVGDTLSHGQTIMILEAMKMEIRVQAPRAGKLARLYVGPDQAVEKDQLLAEIE